jgi:hypothetical protein
MTGGGGIGVGDDDVFAAAADNVVAGDDVVFATAADNVAAGAGEPCGEKLQAWEATSKRTNNL